MKIKTPVQALTTATWIVSTTGSDETGDGSALRNVAIENIMLYGADGVIYVW
ncbi:MAG: hypothetical protein IIB95_03215 [Candidatus Marinimicrobia bacterium]|nr:hypothetical protein [Candidatus Neomarinimicrobiota bacterium]